MPDRRREVVNCPRCGAENPSSAARCAACSEGLTLYIGPARHLPRRFGLGAVMAFVAATAPGLAALRPSPILGVLLLALLPAAVVRATAVVAQRAIDGRPMGLGDTMGVFLGSIGVMTMVAVPSFLAFAAVDLAVGSVVMGVWGGDLSIPIAFAVAGIAGMLVAAWLTGRLWPYHG